MHTLFYLMLDVLLTIASSTTDPFGSVIWTCSTGNRIYATPAIENEMVYVGSLDKSMYAIHAKNGKVQWKFTTEGGITSSVCVAKDRIFFGSLDGHYYAVDAASGKLSWKFKTGGEQPAGGIGHWGFLPADQYATDLWDFYLSTPVAAQDKLFFGSSDGHLYCVDQKTGSLVWKKFLGSSIHATPILHNGTVIAGTWKGDMVALNVADGSERWRFATGGSGVMVGMQGSPVLGNNQLYFGSRNGIAYALDATTGKEIWKHVSGESWLVGTPVLKDGLVFHTSSDTYLVLALDTKTGNPVFQFKANGYLFSSPAIAGDQLYVGDFTGQLYSLSIASHAKKWSAFKTAAHNESAASILNNGKLDFVKAAGQRSLQNYQTNLDVMNDFHSLGAFVSSPVILDSIIFIGSSDGKLYAIRR